MAPLRRATIQDIARHLGVSKGTVSVALSGGVGVSEETRQRVREYAEQIHYRPNQMAKGVSTGRSSLVAVVLSRLTSSFFEGIVQGIENVAAQQGYDIIVCSVSRATPEKRSQNLDEMVERLISRRIDGLVCSIYTLPEAARARVEQAEIPVVYLAPEPVQDRTSVTVDNVLGGRLAAEHLQQLGHRRILLLGGDEKFAHLRFQGAREYLAEHGIACEMRLMEGRVEMEAAYYAISTRVRARRDFTAVFCASDLLAVGACKALRDAGVSVPDEVSVVGFDDLLWGERITPALTTIHQPQGSQGEVIMDLLLRRIQGEEVPSPVLPPRLVVRDSTGPVPV